jgi:membrane fusion protein, multidrug efflux system
VIILRRRLGGALAALLALLAPGCGPSDNSQKAIPPSALIATATVTRGRIAESLETFGTTEFDLERTQSVSLVRAGEIWDVAVVAGLAVRKGDPLLTLGPVPSGSPQVQNAIIDLRFAEQALARARRLAALHLATNQDVQQAEKNVAAGRAALRALGAAGAEPTEMIRAPEDGIVSQVQVTKGSVVQAGQVAVVLASSSAMAVRTGFEVEDVPRLSQGLEVLLEAVYAPPGEKTAPARLARLHRMADPGTQLVEALIAVPDPPAWMVAGERVRVRVILASADDAIGVPREALLQREGKAGVFVVRDGHAHWQPVKIGLRGEGGVQILEGLSGGETVATTGRTALRDGMAVRIQASASESP